MLSVISTQYIAMLNVLLGCTHNAHTRKREKLCNMTKKSAEFSLATAEGIRKAALRPGQRELMGQRVARSASPGTDPGGGVYGHPERPNECPDHPKF